MNRAVHSFNEGLDEAVMQPIARAYVAVTPRLVRTGVRNFFSNLNDVTVIANDALQLKGEQSAADFMRLAVNSTLGLFGVLDIASEMGLRKHEEDFGQTLGYWGVDSGPYVVLPFFGPSSVRDAGGLYVDMEYADLVRLHDDVAERNIASFVRVVSRRADLLDAKQAVDAAALDSYEFMRDFYLERRRHQVTDGKSQDE